jgi:archaellum component FlaF (FlaF/FlaG flagellin family)
LKKELRPRRKSRRWWSRRGISTVVANMMMIGITLSLGAILVAWAGQSYGAFSGGSQLFYQQRGQALQESFVIEEAFFIKSSNTLDIYVRNVGAIQLSVVAIYVNGTAISGSNLQTGTGLCSLYSGNNPLGVQAVCEYGLTVTQANGVVTGGAASCTGQTWCSGALFYVVVASGRGNQAAYTARGP